MTDSVLTRPSLLLRIRNARDEEAWRQFVQLYAPLVYGFARRQGLQDADAADLVQDVMQQVAGAACRLEYDPERGTFRSWLFRVVRNRLHNQVRDRRPGKLGSGDSEVQGYLEQQPAPQEESTWDREYEERLFAWAAERVRDEFAPSSWQAFWLTAVEGKRAQEVSQTVGISVGAVYIARSRILARMTQAVQELQG